MMASRHPSFVQHLARRHTIQPPTLLALGRSSPRRGVPLLSPITPLARRIWEDLLARYATETAGIDTLGDTLAANRELLTSLGLLASLRQRSRLAVGVQASPSTQPEHAVPAGLPPANAAVPGLAASAAMSATLAPVQRAIAQAMGSTLDAGTATGMAAPAAQAPGLTSGGVSRRSTTIRTTTMPTVGVLTLRTESDASANAALPAEQVVPRLPQSLVGGPGTLFAGAMPFHALGAAHRQLDASRRQAPAETAAYSGAAGAVPRTALSMSAGDVPSSVPGSAMPLSALSAAHRQVAVSRGSAAPDFGVVPYEDGLPALLSPGTFATTDRPAKPASTRAQSSPRQAALRQIAGSAGQPLAPVVRRMMEMALGATFADVRIHTGSAAGGAAQALGAQAFTMGRDIYFAPGKFEPGAAGGIALLAHELTHTRQGTAVPLRKAALGAPALEAGDLEPEHLEAEARGTEAAVLRAFSTAPAIPVLSRMVAGSYNALSDEGGSGAEGAWSPFAPRTALSSGGGANAALVEGLASWTSRAGRLRAAPVQRQIVGSAQSSQPVEAFTGVGPQVQRQIAGSGQSGAGPILSAGTSVSAGMMPRSEPSGPVEGPAGSASFAGQATGTPVQRRARRQPAGESLPAATGNAPTAPGSLAGSGAWSAGAGTADADNTAAVNLGNSTAVPASTSGRAAVAPVTALQRFAATGTLLGDLARRRDAHVSPGAVPLSSIFTPGGEGARTSVQRRGAPGVGGSLTFGAGAAGLSALAGGAAFRIAGSQLPAASGATTTPSVQPAGSGVTMTPAVQLPAATSGATTSPSAQLPGSGIATSPSVQRTPATTGASTAPLPASGASSETGPSSTASTGGSAEAASRRSSASSTGGVRSTPLESAESSGQAAALSADYATIPILQRLTAGSLQAPATPPSSDAFAVPLLARMSVSEYGALSGAADTAGAGWAGLGSLSLGGQGAGWATAAGGMLHQVQRMTSRQSGSRSSVGSAVAPIAGGSSIAQESTGMLGGTPVGSFDSPKSLGSAVGSIVSPVASVVQRTGADQAGIPAALTLMNAPVPTVQRTRANQAGTPVGMMSLTGHGHGLAVMSGGLTARALGAAAIQRASTTAFAPYGTAYTTASGSGLSRPTTPGITAGSSTLGFTPVLQRFAAGESGSAALGAALLGRMSRIDESGWAPTSGATLAGVSGVAGGIAGHIQRMAGSVPSGAVSTVGSSADSISASGSVPTTALETGASRDFTSMLGAPAYTAPRAVQRIDSATWMGGATKTLAGQTHGLAAMTGGLTTRALQAAGSGLRSPVQRTGVEQARTGSGGPVTGWGVTLPLQRQLATAGDFTQRFASSAAIGQAATQRFATSAAIGQAAAGAAQRLGATPVLLGGGRPRSGEVAGGPPAIMVSRMWSGRPMGGAMTDDTAPGAAGPTGSPVPGLTEMTQRSQGTSAMLVFNGLTTEDTSSSSTLGVGAPALPVSRSIAAPPSMPAAAASSNRVMVQRASASLASPAGGVTTLAGRSLVVPSPVQRAVTVDEVNTTGADTSTSSADSSSANPGTDLPKDMETLIDTVIKRLKRQLTLDHERAGGFHTSLLR